MMVGLVGINRPLKDPLVAAVKVKGIREKRRLTIRLSDYIINT